MSSQQATGTAAAETTGDPTIGSPAARVGTEGATGQRGPSGHIAFDVADGVATLELRRPEKRNAISAEMCESVVEVLDATAGRPDVRVLVVQGAGGVFSAGADLGAVKKPDGTAADSFRQSYARALRAVVDFPVPSVARIEGPCIGGGCSLALACDLRFAHPSATFAIPAVRHGILYDEPSVARLVRLVGPSRAARLLYTAERIDAAAALKIGFIDECGKDLEALLTDFAGAVALGRPETVVATRRLLRDVQLSGSVPS